MRTLLLAGAVTLALGGTAFAQMCGGGMQQSSTTAQSGGGTAGCMGMMQQAQTDDPMANKPADKPMMSGGMMCPCCKNMAMMGGLKQGGDAQPKTEMAPKQ
jgi:hypothetical protein